MLAIRNLNSLPSLVEEFFNHELPYSWNRKWATESTPAINVVESKNEYRIEVAAPGLDKNDFKINLEKDILTISASKEESKEEKDDCKDCNDNNSLLGTTFIINFLDEDFIYLYIFVGIIGSYDF